MKGHIKYFYAICVVLSCLILCTGCKNLRGEALSYGDINIVSRQELLKETENYLKDDIDEHNIYSYEYKEAVSKAIQAIKNKKEYSIEAPLFIFNPYQDTDGILYVYFGETSNSDAITVSIEDIRGNVRDAVFYHELAKNSLEGIVTGIFEDSIKILKFSFEKYNVAFDFSKIDFYDKSASKADFALDINMLEKSEQLSPGYFYGFDRKKRKYVFYDKAGNYVAGIYTAKNVSNGLFINANGCMVYENKKGSILCIKNTGEPIWCYDFKGDITAFGYNNDFIAVTCSDGDNISLYSIKVKGNSMEAAKLSEFSENNKMIYVKDYYENMSGKRVHITDENTIFLYGTDGNIFNIKRINSGVTARWHASLASSNSNMQKISRNTDFSMGQVAVLEIVDKSCENDEDKNNNNNIISGVEKGNVKLLDITETSNKDKQYMKLLISVNSMLKVINVCCDNIQNEMIIINSMNITSEPLEARAGKMYGSNIIVNYKDGSISEYTNDGTRLYTSVPKKDVILYGKINMSRIFE